MKELNQNHGVTVEMREQYHKLLAFMIWKFAHDSKRIIVTSHDLEVFIGDHPDGINLAVEPKGDILTLRIVNDKEGAALARREGGLPS